MKLYDFLHDGRVGFYDVNEMDDWSYAELNHLIREGAVSLSHASEVADSITSDMLCRYNNFNHYVVSRECTLDYAARQELIDKVLDDFAALIDAYIRMFSKYTVIQANLSVLGTLIVDALLAKRNAGFTLASEKTQ